MNDPQPIAVPAAPARLDLKPIATVVPTDWSAAKLEAQQIDAARALQELRQQRWPADGLAQAAMDRCETLLERSRAAAAARSHFVALDCLMQFERECIGLMSPAQRSARAHRFLAEARDTQSRDLRLWSVALRQADLSDVATVHAMFDVVHAQWRFRMQQAQAQQQRLRALAPLVVASLIFYVGWALLGGFDWLARDDVDVTTGMLMVAGAMSGWLGGVVGVALHASAADADAGTPAMRWWSVARVALGAIVAVPIVLLVEAGLVDLTQLPAAVILLACFLAAIAADRAVARRSARGAARSP